MDYPFSYISVASILIGIIAVFAGIYASATGSILGFLYYAGIILVVIGVVLAVLDFRGKLPKTFSEMGKSD